MNTPQKGSLWRTKKNPTFLTAEQIRDGKKPEWSELTVEGSVKNLSVDLFRFYPHLTVLDVSRNNLRYIPKDIGLLASLQALDLSCNKITNLPAEMGQLFKLKELNLSYNPINNLPAQLGRLYNLQRLGVANLNLSDFRFFHSSRVQNELIGADLTNFMSELLSNLEGGKEPPSRNNIAVCNPNNKQLSAVFSVLCYNILCDKYTSRSAYGYCQSWALAWNYRRNRILEEIKSCDADIVCLQEIETEQYAEYFMPHLQIHGYDGFFKAKSRAKTMSETDRKSVDGCAIFWKSDSFSYEQDWLIEFNQLSIAIGSQSADMLNRVMTKDNIGVAVLLTTKEPVFRFGDVQATMSSQPILVVNCHIHWDPEFSDVKLMQTAMLMSEMKLIVNEATKKVRSEVISSNVADANAIPCIMCGDFNSLPDSGVVEIITHGKIAREHSDFKGFAYNQALDKLFSSTDIHLTHDFRLDSAYEEKHIKYTNYTVDFKGVIDYIFFSKDYMQVLEVLGASDTWDWFNETHTPGCPNVHMPSDHLPLLARFQMPVPLPEPPFNNQRGGKSGDGPIFGSSQPGQQNRGSGRNNQPNRSGVGSTGHFTPNRRL